MANSEYRIGLALSGGGSRAIAFHLGCLRALNRLGILDRVAVISCVSGGSVIGAMYAYSTESFAEYDKRVQKLLRWGLQWSIFLHYLFPPRFLLSFLTTITSGVTAVLAWILDLLICLLWSLARMLRIPLQRKSFRIRPPLRRWVSRTTVFEAVLRKRLGKAVLPAVARRSDLEVVINACDLRTSSAFRFGSKASGCWRFGNVKDNDISLATAVAASAAYPAFLPALDRKFVFWDETRNMARPERVVLTDGGVFDNLGISCFEPGRSSAHTAFVYELDYILCCDAGPGLTEGTNFPYWWPSRMSEAFSTVFKKSTDSSRKLLNYYSQNPKIKGLVHAYLGQQDGALRKPLPPDFVSRERVFNYPTDFAGMRKTDIQALSLRGEQLTEMLVRQYCPALIKEATEVPTAPTGGKADVL